MNRTIAIRRSAGVSDEPLLIDFSCETDVCGFVSGRRMYAAIALIPAIAPAT